MTATHDHRPRSAVVALRKALKRALPLLPDERFRCVGLRAVMRRQECAVRYSDFNRAPGSTWHASVEQRAHVGSSCTGCVVGLAHYRGKRHKLAPTVAMPVRVVQVAIARTVRIGAGGCAHDAPPRTVLLREVERGCPTSEMDEW